MNFKTAILATSILASSVAMGGDLVTTTDDRSDLSMTVYTNGLAMVQDQRQVNIPAGQHMLSFEGVSNLLNAPSALFGGENLLVLQQVFDYALMSDANMLRLSEGQEIQLIRNNPVTGQEEVETATIITTKPQLVVKTKRGIETNLGDKRIVFNNIPNGLSKAPALKLYLNAESAGDKKVDLTYLTDGLNWNADYIGRLNHDRTKMEVRALATITNNTEVAFDNTAMNVIAGDVQRMVSPVAYEGVMMEAADISAKFYAPRHQALGNFQLFKLPEKVSLESQQTRQFPLLPITTVDTTQSFVANHYFSGQKEVYDPNYIERPQTYIIFDNTLNSPMPQGAFRVYETDSDNKDHFTGEMYIEDTAENEPVRLELGQSFNLRVYRKQTEWTGKDKLGSAKASYEVKITNAAETDAIVYVQESMAGNAKIIKESIKGEQIDSSTYQWAVTVPAKGEASIDYGLSVSLLNSFSN